MSAWVWLVLVWWLLLAFIIWRLSKRQPPAAIPNPPRVFCDPEIRPDHDLRSRRTLHLVKSEGQGKP